jgi:hypothetical protein
VSADSRLCSDTYRRGRRAWGGADEPTVGLRDDRNGVEDGRHERRTLCAGEGGGAVEEAEAGAHQRARRRRARTGTAVAERTAANRDSPLPFVSLFSWAVVFTFSF